MKKTKEAVRILLKLYPTPADAAVLEEASELSKKAVEWYLEKAAEEKTMNRVVLLKKYYDEFRFRFNISAAQVQSYASLAGFLSREKRQEILDPYRDKNIIALTQKGFSFENGITLSFVALSNRERLQIPVLVSSYKPANFLSQSWMRSWKKNPFKKSVLFIYKEKDNHWYAEWFLPMPQSDEFRKELPAEFSRLR